MTKENIKQATQVILASSAVLTFLLFFVLPELKAPLTFALLATLPFVGTSLTLHFFTKEKPTISIYLIVSISLMAYGFYNLPEVLANCTKNDYGGFNYIIMTTTIQAIAFFIALPTLSAMDLIIRYYNKNSEELSKCKPNKLTVVASITLLLGALAYLAAAPISPIKLASSIDFTSLRFTSTLLFLSTIAMFLFPFFLTAITLFNFQSNRTTLHFNVVLVMTLSFCSFLLLFWELTDIQALKPSGEFIFLFTTRIFSFFTVGIFCLAIILTDRFLIKQSVMEEDTDIK